MTVIFAKTRHSYDSYSDFWRLVELSGYETCWVDEIDPDKFAVYIFTPNNGEMGPILDRCISRRAIIIWWFLERLDGTPILTDGSIDRMIQRVDEIWVSDRWTATRHPSFRYVCLASHPGFGNDPLPTQFDFTHQSYVWGRRSPIVEGLKLSGLIEGPNAWGEDRDRILRSSKVMLNVQQYEAPVYAPLRFAIAAAYSLPIVSESIQDPYPLDDGSIVHVPYQGLISATVDLIRSPDRQVRGEALFQELCVRRTFRSEIDAAL